MACTFLRAALASALVLAVAACAAPAGLDEDVDADESELAVNEVCTDGTALRVTATKLNLRASASTSAASLAMLPKDSEVTCVGRTGENGWVKVKTGDGETGWVFGKYVVRSGGGAEDEEAPVASGGTCAPSRAANAVGRFQKALHDSIAWAEGTRGRSKDGYDVMFNFKITSSCGRHPNLCQSFGSTCTTAAGRYQFLTTTWNGAANARGLRTFEPDNQERAAAYLIGTVRRVTVPQDRAMTAAEFSNAMSKLSYEWASLPPGRYGQPKRSSAAMRSTYCSVAGC